VLDNLQVRATRNLKQLSQDGQQMHFTQFIEVLCGIVANGEGLHVSK
jgi:hypothetical protein